MKILFFTDNFPPESNAPATRTYEHCVEWLKTGAEVTIITCAPNFPQGKVFPGYKNKLVQVEWVDGIKVIRVWSFISPNRGLLKRILDYLSYSIMAFFASLFVKTDIIIATSPQLFTAVAGYCSATVKRKQWIMEVRDLWPESIKAVGAINERGILKILDQLVMFLYRKASHVVVVTDAFKERIIKCGVDEHRITVVKNGVHLSKFSPEPKNISLIERLNFSGKLVVSYIGTHGMAHKLDFILNAAKKVKDKSIHFLFIGDGAMKQRLLALKDRLKLNNVTMLDAIPKSEVKKFINISDVALINLKLKDTFEKVIPSKIFENAAMQKPILLGVKGEAKELVERFNAGVSFEPENENDFLRQLNFISTDKDAYESYKEGCYELAKAFDRRTLSMSMLGVIEYLAYPLYGYQVSLQ